MWKAVAVPLPEPEPLSTDLDPENPLQVKYGVRDSNRDVEYIFYTRLPISLLDECDTWQQLYDRVEEEVNKHFIKMLTPEISRESWNIIFKQWEISRGVEESI